MAARDTFTAGSFLLRWLVAIAMVLATYNPTGYSYAAWIFENFEQWQGSAIVSIQVFVGILLLILFVIYIRATLRSIGAIGIVMVAALLGSLLWVLIAWNLVNLEDPGLITWIFLFVTATILAVGVSWSWVRRRITGQTDTDVIDES